MSEDKKLVVEDKTKPMKMMGSLEPQNLGEAFQVAKYLSQSQLIPKAYRGKENDIFVAMQMGYELGLKPLQSLKGIAVINGTPTIWGDTLMAIISSKDDFEYCDETFDEDTQTAICKIKRVDKPEQIRTFSLEDARKAGISNRSPVWKTYPKRMAQMRARAFAVRDVFPHHLCGISIKEEVEDYKPIDNEDNRKDLSNEFVDVEIEVDKE